MKLIDEKLGGTTPLEVILKFPKNKEEKSDDDFEDDWGDEGQNNDKYWFTKDKIDKINKVKETGSNQKEILFILGNAMSGAPIIIGTNQLPKPPIIAGITMKKIIIKPCPVTNTLYK